MTWDRTFTAHCTEGHSADFPDLRCTCTDVRSGEPFNKQSFLEGYGNIKSIHSVQFPIRLPV